MLAIQVDEIIFCVFQSSDEEIYRRVVPQFFPGNIFIRTAPSAATTRDSLSSNATRQPQATPKKRGRPPKTKGSNFTRLSRDVI